MNQKYSLAPFVLGGRAGLWLGGLLAAGLAGCENQTEAAPELGRDYFPLEVGAYRVYDVVDTAYQANVPTVSRFQFKEQVDAGLEPDATGQPVYRIIRSRRTLPTQAWQVDSVITVTANGRALTEQRNNRRTVELVFPVREGKSWNINAFNTLDTLPVVNRFYVGAGQPFRITRNGQTYEYNQTVTTINDVAQDVNAAYATVLRTTFARGVGPVYRVRRRFISRCDAIGCNPAFRQQGQSRSEVLIDSGK
ncbi:hypothetical protein HNQ93_002420 [Hymenobacter luteus]|uniref:Lipoprotein n=2 Tax=Hymenobacter TaxID=89966 RepID=A0A7W9T144_9BACT|nr:MULTISPECIES: hypothetical protein [Hymenobacter]MBB4602011.1 hypothetical protein [Hymenobacter latericoloratus]MBB6059560.1 hypothetical protein [Hymenobacter luteus]